MQAAGGLRSFISPTTARSVWQEIQSCTRITTTADASLAEELNNVFSCYEAESPHTDARSPLTSSHSTFILQEHQVRLLLLTTNTRKAARLDRVLGKVLCGCADQLVGVLTRLFNLSLSHAAIPQCLESGTIIPVAVSCPKVSQ